jgi:hypothetical protein
LLHLGEKSFQKKVLCIKVAHRFFTTTAVSDIILLCKTKRAPTGYNYIGEINNHLLCIKFSQIPTGSSQGPPPPPPPIPPRPASMAANNDDGFVVISRQPSPPSYPPTSVNGHSGNLHLQGQVSVNGAYNPLSGVPFEINPAYKFDNDDQGEDIVVSFV